MSLKIFLTTVFLVIILTLKAQKYVVLLIDEPQGKMVVLSKREIRDILTLDHRYLGRADKVTSTGLIASFQYFPIDSIHSIVVKHGNLGEKLGVPFKILGIGLAAVGGLMIKAGADQPADDQSVNDESTGNTGLFVGGVLALGAGFGSFMLGKGLGDRPIEKEKTTYYFHQWTVKIIERKNVRRYKSSLKS